MNSFIKATLDFVFVTIVHPETGKERLTYDECKGIFSSQVWASLLAQCLDLCFTKSGLFSSTLPTRIHFEALGKAFSFNWSNNQFNLFDLFD